MSKFIVTGATGFIGSHLCRKLVQCNHEVHIICREESDLVLIEDILGCIKLFKYSGDCNSLIKYFEEVKPEGVFHIAAVCIAEHQTSDIGRLIESNIKFGVDVLEAMRCTHVTKIINTGTSWQHYEDAAYNPVCLYAASKQAFYDIMYFYVQAYGFRTITLELFDTYGERDPRNKLMNRLKKSVVSQEELQLSEGYQEINLVYIEDVVEAYLCAWSHLEDSTFQGHETYAVASDQFITVRELVSLYETIHQVKLNVSFGKRPYRFREMIKPWKKYKCLPNWKCQVGLKEGILKIGKGMGEGE